MKQKPTDENMPLKIISKVSNWFCKKSFKKTKTEAEAADRSVEGNRHIKTEDLSSLLQSLKKQKQHVACQHSIEMLTLVNAVLM